MVLGLLGAVGCGSGSHATGASMSGGSGGAGGSGSASTATSSSTTTSGGCDGGGASTSTTSSSSGGIMPCDSTASCYKCAGYPNNPKLPLASVCCGASARLLAQFVNCVCHGNCESACLCTGSPPPECQTCAMDPCGCGTEYDACLKDF
jgi:hypothetical protein